MTYNKSVKRSKRWSTAPSILWIYPLIVTFSNFQKQLLMVTPASWSANSSTSPMNHSFEFQEAKITKSISCASPTTSTSQIQSNQPLQHNLTDYHSFIRVIQISSVKSYPDPISLLTVFCPSLCRLPLLVFGKNQRAMVWPVRSNSALKMAAKNCSQ